MQAAFRFIPVTPHPALSAYIARITVFESTGRLPALDKKLIVPNANLKLTLTCNNGIEARIAGKTFIQNEHQLSLSGLIDTPVTLDPLHDAQTGTIIIEFNPLGVYRLFHVSYADVKNQIIDLSHLIGKPANHLRAQLADTPHLQVKLTILQQFLIRQLEASAPDPIYDYCVQRIYRSEGLTSVAQLQKETGYTARWLNTKFSEHLGTGPKNLSEIVRFKQFYQAYSNGAQWPHLKNHIYRYYHDQSHFIRAFKRFTGHTPTDLQNSSNELATKHYTTSSDLYNTGGNTQSIFAEKNAI